MDASIVERMKRAHTEHPESVVTVFTLSGHVLSGRIVALGGMVVLEAGKERAEVPQDRIEAFSLRET
jgi:hypothetical protein